MPTNSEKIASSKEIINFKIKLFLIGLSSQNVLHSCIEHFCMCTKRVNQLKIIYECKKKFSGWSW
jgi:hypothetical protein